MLELYYYGYDIEQVRREGFQEAVSESWDNDKPKSGVKLTDRPPETSLYERALKMRLPEDTVLPYEWPHDSNWYWRVFRIPAVILNQAIGHDSGVQALEEALPD